MAWRWGDSRVSSGCKGISCDGWRLIVRRAVGARESDVGVSKVLPVVVVVMMVGTAVLSGVMAHQQAAMANQRRETQASESLHRGYSLR